MYKSPNCPPPPCEPHRRHQPTWCGPADCTKPGDVYDIQHLKPPMPEPCPGPGYMIPMLRPELRNMTEAQQIQELIDRVDCMTKTFNDYSKTVFGAYEAVVNSATCNDAYYDEVRVQSGFITGAGVSYKVIDIPFLDRADQPIYLELGLAYNNTQNMGVTEDILDASYRTIADKIVTASTGPYINGATTTGWDGIVYYGGAPISRPTHSVNYTLAALSNGFLKVYPNTTTEDVMRNDRVMDAMGCMSVLINEGVATPNLYGSDANETKARVGIGMNYATKHRFIVVTDGTDTIGCTSADLGSIFLNLGCNVAAEVCTGAKAVGVDKGMFMYNPSTVNEHGAPDAPQVCAFWFITKQRHYHNQYVRDVAELTQNVGKQTWEATVANKNVEGMWSEIQSIREGLTTEEAERKEADEALGERIDGVAANLAQEVTDRETADAEIKESVSAETEAREAADSKHDAEIAALQAEDVNIKDSYLPLAGGTMTGTINMNNHLIDSVPNPTEPDHAANKQYVDTGDTILQAQVNAKLPLSGGTMTGAIVMNNQAITGLPTPANLTDAVTKQYADNLKSQMLPSSGGTMTGAINMGNNTITSLGAPVGDTDATNKEYVDGAITSAIKSAEGDADAKYLPLAGGTMTGAIKGLENPTADDEAANKAYVDAQVSGAGTTADGKYLALAGGTMTGPIAMSGQKITGAADPTDAQDVATKAYVDANSGGGTEDALPLAGGTMEGNIDMGTHSITNLAEPTNGTDAATKAYVDEHGGTADALPLAGGTMTGPIAMGGNSITGLPDVNLDSDTLDDSQALNVGTFKSTLTNLADEVAEQVSQDFLPLDGGSMNGSVNMVGNKVTGLPEPENSTDAATKGYVDAQYAEYLPTAGGTMTGPIAMSGQKITGVGDASDDGDAVNYKTLNTSNKAAVGLVVGSFSSAETEILNITEPGMYLTEIYVGGFASTGGSITIYASYADGQKITVWKYGNDIISNSKERAFLLKGPMQLSYIASDLSGIDADSTLSITVVKISDKFDENLIADLPEGYPVPVENPPQQVNLTTATLGTLSATNNNISGTLTLTPGTDPAVITGVKLYYTSEAVLSDTEFADFPASSFEDNSYSFTAQLPGYNTQYTVKAKSYYTGSTISLTQETASEQSVTTGEAPISNIQSFSVSPYSGKRVVAQWKNPASIPEGSFTGVKIEYSTSSISTPGSGTLVYTGIGTTMQAGESSSAYLDLPALATTYYLICYSTSEHGNGTAISTQVNTGTVTTTTVTSSRTVNVPAGYGHADIFLVGGGASGQHDNNCARGGGGGGYTKTLSNTAVTTSLIFVIGAGGGNGATYGNTPGGATSVSGGASGTANGGSNMEYSSNNWFGGNGGSGGGAGGGEGGTSTTRVGGAGGSNGANGVSTAITGGSGQGTTTRAYGDTSGTLYAGGGGGGNIGKQAYPGNGAAGGSGGGGRGAANGITNGTAGSSNTGGGGGGVGATANTGASGSKPGAGGSGLALIRWKA